MIITKLELENWKNIPFLTLEFRPGINLIYGRNEIGKSSIIEALRKAILGNSAASGVEYQALKSWGTDVNARVNLFFTTSDSQNYQVQKSFPKGIGNLFREGIKLSEDPKKTQEKLFKILGVPEKTANLFHLLFIDQGESINLFQKKNSPLDENTKTHIKEVIRETALKELQALENVLKQEWDKIFTSTKGKLKTGAQASDYKKCLDKEKELKEKLDELEEKEKEFQKKLEEIERADKQINDLETEKKKKQEELKQLQEKRTKLDEIEKKKLEFKPLEEHYTDFSAVSRDLEAVQIELPTLYAVRNGRMEELRKKIAELEKEKKQLSDYAAKLKIKREEYEKIEEKRYPWEKLKKDYEEILKLKKQIRENYEKLPELLSFNKKILTAERQKVTVRIEEYHEKQKESAAVEKQLKTYPQITQNEFKGIRKVAEESKNMRIKLDSFLEELKLSLKIIPLKPSEIAFQVRKDNSDLTLIQVKEPVEFSDFRKLYLTYANEFGLDVRGTLSKTDLEGLERRLSEKEKELRHSLQTFGVETLEELEKKYETCHELKVKVDNIQAQLKAMESSEKLTQQKGEIEKGLADLTGDIARYLEKGIALDRIPLSAALNKTSGQEIRDQLTTVKANIDTLKNQVDAVLRERLFEKLEKEFREKEQELKKLQEDFAQIEPKELEKVTPKDLEKADQRLNETDKKVALKQNELKLLEGMKDLLEFPESLGKVRQPGPFSSQELRDTINRSLTRLGELKKQKADILKEKSEDDFKKEYDLKKDEIKALDRKIADMEPVKLNALKDIKSKIVSVEGEINRIVEEKAETDKRRERLIGEIADFSRVKEEKNDLELAYRHTLESIQAELSQILSLKLLLKTIEEEKEKAQQEIFKPLQERVARSFEGIVGSRYKIGIDNHLNLAVAGQTLTGDYQPEVDNFISFGTKEQLSFVVRLSIAEQLSKKEPQIMVLDDSFVNTDTHRLPLLLQMIKEKAKNIQFLVFTCREEDYLAYKDDFYCIDLERQALSPIP